MQYFKKENPRQAVYDGKTPVPFEIYYNGQLGLAQLDETKPEHAGYLRVLSEHAERRAGGVVKISAEIYESLKKNAASVISQRSSRQGPIQPIRVQPSQTSIGLQPAAPPVAVAKGIRVMESEINNVPPSSIAQFRARFQQKPK